MAQSITEQNSFFNLFSVTTDKVTDILNSNCTVGEKIEIDGVTVVPISKVNAGFAGGGSDIKNDSKKKSQNPAGAGAKVSLTPVTLLVFENGTVRLESVTAPKSGVSLTSVIKDFITLQKKKSAAK